jgi:predicted Zn-dependent peptidase
MKKYFLLIALAIFCSVSLSAQEVEYSEYDLDNGLHVILHEDHSAPVVTVGVMYHVGAKDEEQGRTGFAHFFEHLLFEGTDNIKRGEWFNIVSANGGSNNANTTQDRTYYYETFPSNNLELGLWMESERMMHPVINQVGVDTQNEVVKEEKRSRVDNAPYGKIIYGTAIAPHMFDKHPYKNSVIGTMKDLDAAQLSEFKAFFDKYYVPNNAVLTIAGDIDKKEARKMIKDYFGPIEKKSDVKRVNVKEQQIEGPIVKTEYDNNIQIPAKIFAYRTPAMTDKDAYVLQMISTLLTSGKSSRMYKSLVDEKKQALQVLALPRSREDYGTYVMGALSLNNTPLDTLANSMDTEIDKIKNNLISKREYQKLQNEFENRFVNSNSSVQSIANSLARYYMLYDNTNLINEEIEIYRDVTRKDIKRVANKYLKENRRLELDYRPTPENK